MDGTPPRRQFTVDEYERMIAAGIIREGERVELVEGEIVHMAAMGGAHAACVRRTDRWFERRVGEHAIVSVQCPIRLPPRGEPEPDIALLRPRADFYAAQHPGPGDVLLVIEVSDATLAYDRRVKVPMYARAGVSELWVVDVQAGTVEVHRDPRGNHYQQVALYRRGDRLSPLAFPDLSIGVAEIVGE